LPLTSHNFQLAWRRANLLRKTILSTFAELTFQTIFTDAFEKHGPPAYNSAIEFDTVLRLGKAQGVCDG
jgi:hypothetical protein